MKRILAAIATVILSANSFAAGPVMFRQGGVPTRSTGTSLDTAGNLGVAGAITDLPGTGPPNFSQGIETPQVGTASGNLTLAPNSGVTDVTGALTATGVLSGSGLSATHATSHDENGSDELLLENLGTAVGSDLLYRSNGSGGIVATGVTVDGSDNVAIPGVLTLGDTVTDDGVTALRFKNTNAARRMRFTGENDNTVLSVQANFVEISTALTFFEGSVGDTFNDPRGRIIARNSPFAGMLFTDGSLNIRFQYGGPAEDISLFPGSGTVNLGDNTQTDIILNFDSDDAIDWRLKTAGSTFSLQKNGANTLNFFDSGQMQYAAGDFQLSGANADVNFQTSGTDRGLIWQLSDAGGNSEDVRMRGTNTGSRDEIFFEFRNNGGVGFIDSADRTNITTFDDLGTTKSMIETPKIVVDVLEASGEVTQGTGTIQTTDATVTTLDTFTIATNDTVHVRVRITARDTANNANIYVRECGAKDITGTVSVLSVSTPFTHEDDSDWDATLDASGSTVRVRVTGEAATTIDWEVTWEVF